MSFGAEALNEAGADVETTEFLAVARVVRPQGRRGEVSAEILTDFAERFERLDRVFLATDSVRLQPADAVPARVERAWPHKGRIILKIAGVDSIAGAEQLRGKLVVVPYAARVELPENTYYWSELEGCRVLAGPPAARFEVGEVTAVEPTAGVPILHVTRAAADGDEILVPLAQEICTAIDPEAKLIVIDPPEDLLELNRDLSS